MAFQLPPSLVQWTAVIVLSLCFLSVGVWVVQNQYRFHQRRVRARRRYCTTTATTPAAAGTGAGAEADNTVSDGSSNNMVVHTMTTTTTANTIVIAFFHPHCSAGGGGERVLWKMVQVLEQLKERGFDLAVIIYTVDAVTPTYRQDLLQHVQSRFSITVGSTKNSSLPLQFVHLDRYRHYLDPSPRLSMVMESAGTVRLAWKALGQQDGAAVVPDVFVDTTGAAFTFLPAKLIAGCRCASYVHYPTISTDMLQLVWERRRSAYNHDADIAASGIKTVMKLMYYTVFAAAYGVTGSLADWVFVNSTWTANHIHSLWWWSSWRNKIRILFPPCNVEQFMEGDSSSSASSPREEANNKKKRPTVVMVSIGQFRPEKDHALQLEAVAKLRDRCNCNVKVKLVLIGSCRRGSQDEELLKDLQRRASELHLLAANDDEETPQVVVEFCVNQPYPILRDWLRKASIGLHTMWNEHFGIAIVEMMAAGLLVIAHNSGGPQTDIIVPYTTTTTTTTAATTTTQPTGFLASTANEYADAMLTAITLPAEEAVSVRRAAVESSQRFSDQVFATAFEKSLLESKLLLPSKR